MKKLLTGALLIGVIATGVGVADAAKSSRSSEFAANIAERFNLDQSEVEQFMTEKKEERRAEKSALMEEKISELVQSGELTVDQAEIIRTQIQAKKDLKESLSSQDLSKEEMKEQLMASREESKQLLEDAGINLKDIFGDQKQGRKGYRRN